MEAAASTAPAKAGRKPARFITGIVITPVDTTFESAAPEIVPNIAELATAACAAPPVRWPVSKFAIFIKSPPAPHDIKMAPKTIKTKTFLETTCNGAPKTPPVSTQKACVINVKF